METNNNNESNRESIHDINSQTPSVTGSNTSSEGSNNVNVNEAKNESEKPNLISSSEPIKVEAEEVPQQEDFSGIDKQLYDITMMYAEKLQVERIDITAGHFKWWKIAQGLANSFGERGRKLFHLISSAGHPKYDIAETDKFYSDVLSRKPNKKRIQPSAHTVIRFAREAGAIFYRDRVKGKGDNTNELAFNIIQEKYPAVFDELSQDYLVNGKPINDQVINTILVDLAANHRVETTKEFVQAVIESSYTERINQFHDFIDKYRHRANQNGENMEKLAKCIRSKTGISLGFNYKLTMIRLFLIKLIAQIFDNIPNDLLLVFLGGQFIGKTEFFKRLLPEELSHMFSMQPFRADKDAKRDAARYVLILDDEFRGLKLATTESLKSQLSMTTINLRVPYGRKPHPFKRIASYCAASNERFILKDVTGNRRLICFWIESIDWELYNSINKVDLFMEAYDYYVNDFGHELDKELLEAISIVSKEFEVSSSAEEIMMQFLPPGKLDDAAANWMPVHQIIQEIEKTHGVKLSDYEVGKTLRKLGYKHKFLDVNGSKLLCWLVKMGNTKNTNFNNVVETDF